MTTTSCTAHKVVMTPWQTGYYCIPSVTNDSTHVA